MNPKEVSEVILKKYLEVNKALNVPELNVTKTSFTKEIFMNEDVLGARKWAIYISDGEFQTIRMNSYWLKLNSISDGNYEYRSGWTWLVINLIENYRNSWKNVLRYDFSRILMIGEAEERLDFSPENIDGAMNLEDISIVILKKILDAREKQNGNFDSKGENEKNNWFSVVWDLDWNFKNFQTLSKNAWIIDSQWNWINWKNIEI